MPHYLTPLSSVTTITTCRLEGRSPRRPKTSRIVPDECPCGHSSTDTDSSTSKDSIASEPPSQAEVECLAEAETVPPVDQFIDAMECSVKDEISDQSSVTSEVLDDSPIKSELSSDVSPAKSAISEDSPLKCENSDASSDESEKLGASASPVTSESPDVSSAASAAAVAPFSQEHLEAAADVIGTCGQSSSRRRAVQQPRDFSRERPPGVRHIRQAVKRTKRRKSANPKRQRKDTSDITDLMRTTFFPCD